MLTLEEMKEIAEHVMSHNIFFRPKARVKYRINLQDEYKFIDLRTLVFIAFKAGISYEQSQQRKKEEK